MEGWVHQICDLSFSTKFLKIWKIKKQSAQFPHGCDLTHLSFLTVSGTLLGWSIPGVLEQRPQNSILVFRSELFLGYHLSDHLLSNAFKGLLFTVKNCHTWLKFTESNVTSFYLQRKNDNKFAWCHLSKLRNLQPNMSFYLRRHSHWPVFMVRRSWMRLLNVR